MMCDAGGSLPLLGAGAPLSGRKDSRHSGFMMLPVFIPEWQIGSRDIAVPIVGEPFRRVLVFSSDDGNPAMHYGSFGQETTVVATAVPLAEHPGGVQGAYPTELRCAGFSLYWDAPHRVRGDGAFTGIVSTNGEGAAPAGFSKVHGGVCSLAMVSLLYASAYPGSRAWAPAPGNQQQFRPVDSYPPWQPSEDSLVSPQWKVTGVLVVIDTDATPVVKQSAASKSRAAEDAKPATSTASAVETGVGRFAYAPLAGTIFRPNPPEDHAVG